MIEVGNIVNYHGSMPEFHGPALVTRTMTHEVPFEDWDFTNDRRVIVSMNVEMLEIRLLTVNERLTCRAKSVTLHPAMASLPVTVSA